jgi:hypothetical protein
MHWLWKKSIFIFISLSFVDLLIYLAFHWGEGRRHIDLCNLGGKITIKEKKTKSREK